MILQDQYQVLQQSIRTVYIKIDLLNNSNIKIAEIQGNAISGSINIDAKSVIRRTCNLSMLITDSSFLIGQDKKIWLDKRIRLWIGILNFLTGEIVWFDKGIYALNKPNIKYNISEKSLSIEGLDLMCLLDGTLSGTLESPTQIPVGTDISTAIKSTVQDLGHINNVMVNNISQVTPYTIEKNAEDTVYDLLKELSDLYMNWEIFFDEQGKFIYQQIKNRQNDPILWDFSQDSRKLTTDFSIEPNWQNIKNKIIVYGTIDNGTQIKGIAENTNTNNPFSITSLGETRTLTITDENISNNNQALDRANYELDLHSNFNEKIGISCVPIYLLDVNRIVYFNNPEINLIGKYLIETITIPLNYSDEMSFTAYKIYD